MAGPASLFREIHRLRRFLRDAQEQLDRIPRQRKAYQAKLARQEQTLKEEQETIKKLKVTSSEREKTLKSTHEQIGRYERQFESVTNKKEYDALRLEIAAGKEKCGRLEDEILAAMTDSEDRAAKIPELEKAVVTVRNDLARFDAETAPRKELLESEVKAAQGQLVAIEKQIPDDLRSQYNRTILSLGADGFAVVQNRNCMNCHTEIIRQVELDLAHDMFMMCSSCGRILYLPTSAKPAEEEAATED